MALNIYVPPNGASLSENLLYAIWLQGGGGGGGGGPVDIIADHVGLAKNATLNELIDIQVEALTALEALNIDTSDLNKEATQLQVLSAIQGLNFDTSDLNKEVTQLEVRDAILGLDFDTSDLNKEATQLEVRDAIIGLNLYMSDLNKELTQLEVRDAILGLNFDTSDLNKEVTQLEVRDAILGLNFDTSDLNKELTQLEVRDAILGLNFDTSDLNKEVTQLEIRDKLNGLSEETTQVQVLTTLGQIEGIIGDISSAIIAPDYVNGSAFLYEDPLNPTEIKSVFKAYGNSVFLDAGGGSYLAALMDSNNRPVFTGVSGESVFMHGIDAESVFKDIYNQSVFINPFDGSSVFKDENEVSVFTYEDILAARKSVFHDFFGKSVFVDETENVSWLERIDLHIGQLVENTTDTNSVFKTVADASVFKPTKIRAANINEGSSFEADCQAEFDALTGDGKTIHSYNLTLTNYDPVAPAIYKLTILYND